MKGVKSLLVNLVLSCSIFLLAGCSIQSVPAGLEESMSAAGKNRSELFDVIRHYQETGDSLKLQAALFLIGNMTDKGYMEGAAVDEFYSFIDSVYQIRQEEYDIPAIYEAFRNRARHLQEPTVYRADLQTLTADYLIRNIDEAFAVWDRPWNRNLSFNEFCEWILPYRISTEQPEAWRASYRRRFEPLLLDSIQTAREACRAINDELIRLPIHLAISSVLPIALRPSTLQAIKFGLCNDYANLATFAMRAVGIPVAIEIVPHWGRSNNRHVFNVVRDNDGSMHDFSGAEQNPDEHLVRFRYEIPKVYRRTFGKQPQSLAMQRGTEEVPPFFRNPYLVDATGNYPFIETRTLRVPLKEQVDKHFAYLCVFDPQGWVPVAWGRVEGDTAVFPHIGPNIVYHATTYADGKLNLTGDPFLLDTLGQITYYTPKDAKQDVVLERKSKEAKRLAYLPPLMVGCQFQGANDSAFKHPVTFHTIAEEPDFKYRTVAVTNPTPVRYVRYRSSERTWGNMSEVEFYAEGSDKPIKGKPFGHYVPSIYYPRNSVEMLFDGDPLTFFHSQDTLSWGGLELEQPTVITQIRYLIRNDDNGIRKGHHYELFYMKGGAWQSLGKQVATEDDRLLYQQVPQGALYWLRDLTRGKEERIFEIRDNKVIWQ